MTKSPRDPANDKNWLVAIMQRLLLTPDNTIADLIRAMEQEALKQRIEHMEQQLTVIMDEMTEWMKWRAPK